jgi:hypothetical protein
MSDILKPIFDGLTAFGTVSMALATLIVILDGRRQRRDFERRYDSFRPVCVLTPYDGVDPKYRRDTLLVLAEKQPLDQGFGIVEIKCALRNVGAGPRFEY